MPSAPAPASADEVSGNTWTFAAPLADPWIPLTSARCLLRASPCGGDSAGPRPPSPPVLEEQVFSRGRSCPPAAVLYTFLPQCARPSGDGVGRRDDTFLPQTSRPVELCHLCFVLETNCTHKLADHRFAPQSKRHYIARGLCRSRPASPAGLLARGQHPPGPSRVLLLSTASSFGERRVQAACLLPGLCLREGSTPGGRLDRSTFHTGFLC